MAFISKGGLVGEGVGFYWEEGAGGFSADWNISAPVCVAALMQM